jgi:septation ring formation regulator EzrA
MNFLWCSLQLRTKIDKHLDKLQESLMKELTEKENGITIETRELLVSLDEKQKELTDRCPSCMIVWFDLDYRC